MSKIPDPAGWHAEFYPTPIEKLPKGCSKADAIKHSLQKWRGLLPKNLKKYGLIGPPISISSSTCSLCHLYFDETWQMDDTYLACRRCPIYEYKKEHASILKDDALNCIPEYEKYKLGGLNFPGRPNDMIALLENVLAWQEEKDRQQATPQSPPPASADAALPCDNRPDSTPEPCGGDAEWGVPAKG